MLIDATGDDARVLADAFAPGVQLDGTVVPLDELPEGLTLLYGDGGDADAYERRVDRSMKRPFE